MNFKELAKNLGLKENEYMELIDLFIEVGMLDLEKLQAAIDEGNSEEAADAAHSVKGASGNLGIMDFYELSAKIEMDAREGNLQGLAENVQALSQSLNEIAARVKKMKRP